MLKVVLTSFFFIILAELALDTILLLLQLVFCSYTLFGTLKTHFDMAEWLSFWTLDQTVVGSTPIIDELIFLCQIFFFQLQYSDIFSILICHK